MTIKGRFGKSPLEHADSGKYNRRVQGAARAQHGSWFLVGLSRDLRLLLELASTWEPAVPVFPPVKN